MDLPMELKSQPRQRTAWFAIAAVFFVNGVTLASWISRIPTLAERLDLSPGQVGLALMALAAGALVAFPTAGRLVDTRSSAFTVICFAVVMIASLPLVGVAPQLLALFVALFVVGFGNGGMDVSMNAQGIQVQRVVGRSIISSLHGCYSLGAFAGAAIGAGVAQLGVPPLVHFLGASVFGLAVLSWIRRWLIPDAKDARKSEA
ncbi:MAG TPA: MFS transporter, partial [Thermomicrobiales bacterium]|nr:MFS transporter [Thermomicrobiales bacterium]